MFRLLALLCSLALTGAASERNSNYTVTHEAWFELEVKDMDGPGDHYRGKFTVGLFGEVAPMTVLNFVSLAKGYKVREGKLHYKGSLVHRVVTDFVVQMGDVKNKDGSGGTSIYGNKFNDEPFVLSHRSPGWVSMANHGPDTNGSQFFVLLVKARWLDGFHVVFGKVVKGFDVLRTVGEVPVQKGSSNPKKTVRIVDCDAKQLDTPYVLKPEELDSTDDL